LVDEKKVFCPRLLGQNEGQGYRNPMPIFDTRRYCSNKPLAVCIEDGFSI